VRALVALLLAAGAGTAQMRVVAQPGKSPLVAFRIVFLAGSAADPVDKPGLAYLTAMLLGRGGTQDMTYRQVVDAMFPMAASLDVQVDKEMVTFSGETSVETLKPYYRLLSAMLLEPGWREDDFRRVRDDAINNIKVGLRSNDEELAKEVLYADIFAGTPYAHFSAGTVSSLEKITLDDVKQFYRDQYCQSHLILGISGGFSQSFLDTAKKDFRSLPVNGGFRPRIKPPAPVVENRAVVVDKDTRSVAYSIGFPILLTRATSDYPALLLATTYLGQHRMSVGVLYQTMREQRGLNYGDYAYIEYFPRGMYLMEPPPNLARQYQIFQMWIRPVEPKNAVFALRLGLYELAKLRKDGISEDDFERTREFLSKYVDVLTRTRSAALGYAIDSIYYGTPDYPEYIQKALAKLTRDEVNRVIRQFLRADRLVIAAVSNNGEELKKQLASGAPSPITYNSPKPEAILKEDKTVETWPLELKPENIKVIPVDQVFQ
jgi:zinc protease